MCVEHEDHDDGLLLQVVRRSRSQLLAGSVNVNHMGLSGEKAFLCDKVVSVVIFFVTHKVQRSTIELSCQRPHSSVPPLQI